MSEALPASAPGPGPSSDRLPPSAERQEQRQYPRFKLDGATVILGKQGILASLGLGVKKDIAVNLSQGGVLALAPRKFAPKTRLRLTIEIPKWSEIIDVQGEVRWCTQSARTETHFYTGLSFIDLNPLDAKRIARMYELANSVDYRAKAGAREASSGRLKPPKV
jgi:hypothetical protein